MGHSRPEELPAPRAKADCMQSDNANTNSANGTRTDATAAPCDYYATLGVPRSATTEDINAAYKAAARKHHPDRHVNKSEEEIRSHERAFKDISEAHEILSDPAKKSAYDLFGHAGVASSGAQDDMAAQAMFEQVFGVGDANSTPRKKRILGGALFVDERRGDFFQRSWDPDDIEAMRTEMTTGLEHGQDVRFTSSANGTAELTMLSPLPHGVSWEVRLIETDDVRHAVVVTLCGKDEDHDTAASLRMQRIFALPEDVDLDKVALHDSIDESGALLSIRAIAHAPQEEHKAAFAIGEEPRAKTNRAARRRAKHDGIKAGFLNTKARENVVPPMAARQRACKSPVSVRADIDQAGEA